MQHGTSIRLRLAADLASTAAGVIDTELQNASDEFIGSIAAYGDGFRLHRAEHRKRHLDKIHELIGTA